MYVPLQSDWKDGGHCQSRERPGGDQTTGHPPQPREQHDCSVSQKDALTVLVMFVEKGFFFNTYAGVAYYICSGGLLMFDCCVIPL